MNTFPKLTEKEQLIVNIISDHVIFARIARSMLDIINVINPSKGEEFFEPEMNYIGVSNALDLLSISYEDKSNNRFFRDEMFDQFVSMVYSDNEDNHKELAYSIYFEWLRMIKDFYTTKKAS